MKQEYNLNPISRFLYLLIGFNKFVRTDIKFLSSRQNTYHNAEINSIETDLFYKVMMLFNDEYNEKLLEQTFNGWQCR